MPIRQFDGIRRWARLGKIRQGYLAEKEVPDKRSPGKTKIVTHPVNTPYFVVKADASTATDMAVEFARVYGEKPTAVLAEFPLNDRDRVFPYWMKRYGMGGKLLCRGDGETALRPSSEDPEEMEEITCCPEKCEYAQPDARGNVACSHVGSLFVLLPELSGWGVWQMDIRGWNSIVRILSLMDELEGMHNAVKGQPGLVGIPFTLVKRPYDAHPWLFDKETGEKKQITTHTHIVDYDLPRVRLADIRAQLSKRVQGMASIDWDNPYGVENAMIEESANARRALVAKGLPPQSDEELDRDRAALFGADPPAQAKPEPRPAAKPVDLAGCIGTENWMDHPAPRPWDAETVRSEIARRVEWNVKHPKWGKLASKDPSPDALDFLRSLAGQAMRDDGNRHDVYQYLFGVGVDSSSNMTAAQVSSLIWWIKNGTNGPNEFAAKEAALCLTARMREAGQADMFVNETVEE